MEGGRILSAGDAVDGPFSHPLPLGEAAMFTARCPGKTTPNEDAAAIIPYGDCAAVLIVADGVGGHRSGEQASIAAVQALQRCLTESARRGALLRSAILDGIETANQEVLAGGLGSAATLAVVEINGHSIRPFHVGDCVILVLGQRGKLKMQTVAHSPVGFAVEAGLLDDEEAMHHEDRHLVSNVIGAADMRIEIGSTLDLAPRDTLLVSSDGLLDNLHLDEIVDFVRKGRLDAAAQNLAEAGVRRMTVPEAGAPSKPDDLTFIMYRRDPQPVDATQPAPDG